MLGRKHGRYGRTAAVSAVCLTASLIMSFVPVAPSGASLTNVTIGESIVGTVNPALKAALQYGYFTQEGLNVTMLPPIAGGTAVLVSGLTSGSFDIANTGYVGIAVADQAGANIVQFVGDDYGPPALEVLVSKQFAAANGLTKKTPWQTVMTDLKGAVFAVQSAGGTSGLMPKALLSIAGLPANWMTFLTITSETGTDTALASNQVQATIFQFPGLSEIPANGDAVDLFPMSVLTVLKKTVNAGIYTTTSYAAANPNIVKKIAKGIAWGDNLLLDPTTRALALKTETNCFPSFSAKTLLGQTGYQYLMKNGAQPPSIMANTALVDFNLGVLKTQDTPAQVLATYSNVYLPKSYVKPILPPRKYWSLHVGTSYC